MLARRAFTSFQRTLSQAFVTFQEKLLTLASAKPTHWANVAPHLSSSTSRKIPVKHVAVSLDDNRCAGTASHL